MLRPQDLFPAFRRAGRVAADSSLRLVLIAIANRQNHNENRGAFPSADTIADDTGLSLSTVKRAVAKAAKDGWLVIEKARMYGKQYTHNVYVVTIPASIELLDESIKPSVMVTPGLVVDDSNEEAPDHAESMPLDLLAEVKPSVMVTQTECHGDTLSMKGNHEDKTHSFAIAHESSAVEKLDAPTMIDDAYPEINVHCRGYCERHGIKDADERWREFCDMVLYQRPDLYEERYDVAASNAFRAWVQGRREWNLRAKPWMYGKEPANPLST